MEDPNLDGNCGKRAFVCGVWVNREKVGNRRKRKPHRLRRHGSAAGSAPVAYYRHRVPRGGPPSIHHLPFARNLLRRRWLLRSAWVTFLFFLQLLLTYALFLIVTLPLLIRRVSQSANASEIKKAYYKLSLKQYVFLPLETLSLTFLFIFYFFL